MATLILLALLAQQQYPVDGEPIIPPTKLLWVERQPDVFVAQDPSQQIDVLYIISNGVTSSQATADSLCASYETAENLVLANDPANISRVHKVGCKIITYTAVNANTDFNWISTVSGGGYAQGNAWRNELGADVVQFVTTSSDWAGLGYQCAALNGAAYGYSWVNNGTFVGNKSGVHEMGHNLCLAHDLPNQNPPSFPYGSGFCDSAHGRRDPMVYPSPCGGSRVDYFGNPNISPFGYPFGDALNADNARVWREQAATVAAFRSPVTPPTCNTITVLPATLANGYTGRAYGQLMSATGASGGYTLSVSAGSLPAGLALNTSTKFINGTPTTPGASTFTIKATDSLACTGSTTYTLTILQVPSAPTNLAPVVPPAPDGSVPSGASFSFTHDRLNTTYYATCVDSAACVSAGFPASNAVPFVASDGTHSFKVQGCNPNGCTPLGNATGNPITVLINSTPPPPPPVCPTITLSPASLLAGQVGTAYSRMLQGVGGGSPYSFAVTSGSLPAGLTLTVQGVLSGTPTTAINATFTVRATDANACTGSQAYLLTINAAPPPPPSGTLLDWEFPSSSDPRFAGTTWQSTLGPDGVVGWMGVAGSLSTDTAVSATSTGTVRMDWYVRVRDGLVQNGNSADMTMLLLPESGSIAASNAAASVTVVRRRQSGASAASTKIAIQNGRKSTTLSQTVTRGVWHKYSVLCNMTAHTAQLLLDNVLIANMTFPNTALVSIARLGLISGSNTPITDVDSLRVVAQ